MPRQLLGKLGSRQRRGRDGHRRVHRQATLATGSSFYVDTGLTPETAYYYVVSAIDPDGEGANSSEVAGLATARLFGAVIGSAGSHGSLGATKELAFDGSLANYFDAPESVASAGLDLGAGVSAVPTAVKYAPRKRFGSRMLGGKFQASNTPDFSSDVVDLFTVIAAPPEGQLTTETVDATGAFRYFRYLSPENGYGNVAEVEFHGRLSGALAPATPAVPSATMVEARAVTLAWSNVVRAERYNLKRSTASGGPYTIVASGSFTSFTDQNLSAGTMYHYVVGALNKLGETSSPELTVTTDDEP